MQKKITSVVLCLAMLVCTIAFAIPANAVSVDTQPVGKSLIESPDDFSWDNVNMYFLLTDRFYNGNTSNDHSYGRTLDANGQPLSGWNTAPGTFHGGDFAGLTKKIEEGYFDKLGVNALWISAPYEQIHGYVTSGGDTNPAHFAHYSYHGYYVLDYTETDANFGTKAEFKTMVDTAHKHGIRVVMDIVMNHAGYNNLLDMEAYGYGTLKSGYQQYKYRLTNANDFHTCIDYESSASDWGKWWGPKWIRSGLPGYEPGGGEVTGMLAGLPDFRTESTEQVSVPQFLQTKWQKEGTLNQKLSKYGSSGTVSDYLTSWLAQWVEDYGVDGFRCDTAKHVEMGSWVKLKNKCVAALKKWRQNNPSAVGADWDEDFWMTGEHWGHGLGKDGYYTSGAFDSMINFSITGSVSANPGGLGGPETMEGMYSRYASELNNDPNYNVLTYLSSHDTGLVRQNLAWQGTAFQLLPGGIQIFYGDETSRPLVSGVSVGGDGHAVRSDMNFGQNADLLAHWQKVGKFRANHVAVGAGSHHQISAYNSSTGYTFSRSYVDDNVSDSVVCCIGAPANQQIAVDVSSVFGNGKTVTNEYDGTTAVVQNGKATFNSGKQGVILISGPQSTISMNLKGTTPFTDSTTITVSLRGADYAMVSVAGGTPFRVTDGQTFQVGEGIEVGTTFDITMSASNGTDQLDKVFTFKKKDPNAVTTIYFDDSQLNWGSIKAYIYDESGTEVVNNGAWPGQAMQIDSSTGYYFLEVPDNLVKGLVIFSGNNGRYPADGAKGLEINETDMIFRAGNSWTPYDSGGDHPVPTTPSPSGGINVYFNESAYNWGNVHVYIYDESVSPKVENAAWPGQALTLDSKTGYYKLSVPENLKNGMVIFNGSNGRYPADMQPGMPLGGQSHLFDSGNSWTVMQEPTDPPTDPPTQAPTTTAPPVIDKVLIGDVDLNGNVNIVDATEVQKHIVESIKLTGAGLKAADVNADNAVNIKDVTAIQYYAASKFTHSENCGKTM